MPASGTQHPVPAIFGAFEVLMSSAAPVAFRRSITLAVILGSAIKCGIQSRGKNPRTIIAKTSAMGCKKDPMRGAIRVTCLALTGKNSANRSMVPAEHEYEISVNGWYYSSLVL
jgi:hypothetical protein